MRLVLIHSQPISGRDKLKHEQAHRRAMEILIELANEHYNIDIRKNSGTKQ